MSGGKMFYKISEQHLQNIFSLLTTCKSDLNFMQMSNVIANLKNLEKVEEKSVPLSELADVEKKSE